MVEFHSAFEFWDLTLDLRVSIRVPVDNVVGEESYVEVDCSGSVDQAIQSNQYLVRGCASTPSSDLALSVPVSS